MEKVILAINKLISWIKRNSRIFFLWLILISSFILFEGKVSNLISKYSLIGEQEVNSEYFYTLFLFVKASILMLFIWGFITNYRFSKYFNFWLSFVSVSYYFLKRNNYDNLIFLEYEKSPDNLIYYADIFLLLGFGIIIMFIRNLFKDFKLLESLKTKVNAGLYHKKEMSFSEYEEDMPIDGSILGDNDKIVNTLVAKIDDLKPLKAFVIGINAEWGNGKTTFLNRLYYQFNFNSKRENLTPIIFWFNAWQHQDEKSIINNFFNQLKRELSNYSGDAKKSINNYLSKLLAIIDNKYSKGLNFFSDDVLNNDISIKDYYEDINRIISLIDRKIIVLVDDLDRLNKDEIIEVLRILRNVADFNNTIFICGFDKSYVLKIGEFESNFLDKIFNLEVNLPKLHQNGLNIFFKQLIESSKSIKDKTNLIQTYQSIFATDTDNMLDFTIDDIVSSSVEPTIQPVLYPIPLSPSLFFETRRDIKRFYNNLITNLSILGNIEDVELEDYLMFKLLTFKYAWLNNYFDTKRLNIWLGNDSILKFEKWDFIESNNKLELVDKLTIYTVLDKLFPNSRENSLSEGSRKINQRRYLPIYLNNNLFNQSFSYSELLEAHKNLTIDVLIQKKILKTENESYLLNDIKSFILKEENLNSIENFKHTVDIIKNYLDNRVTDSELIYFIHIGEKLKGFPEFAENNFFNSSVDVFGRFLGELNLYYTQNPNDIGSRESDIGSFFSRLKLNELSIINRSFVKDKIISLFSDYLNVKRNLQEVSKIMFYCTLIHVDFFYLRLYYDEAVELYSKYLKNNFKEIFINNTPEEFVNVFNVEFMASLFINQKDKNTIIEEANRLLTERTQWNSTDLYKKDFLINGWYDFLLFLSKSYIDIELSKEEIKKVEDLIEFLKKYIKAGFSIPNMKL
jgi:KAP family P-loop domain